MELELGLKITRTRDDVSSSVDFRFSKDPFGPLVLSRETDSRFIIIIHLKGFKKEGIEIEINKEGNRITISGRKPVEEMVLIRWMAWRKEVELKVFKKVFLIPNIVDLDKIKARFDDDDSTLTITMPKSVKGISGFKIEEEDEEEEGRVDFRDVSEVENREETENVKEVEEENVEREHSEKFETEIQREFMEDKERESHALGEEEETEDDNLEKTQQIDEQDKILEFVEEETITSKQELADTNKESEDSSLRKLPGIEGRDSNAKTRHGEQGNNQEQQDSQVETKSDDLGSRAVEEEIEEQEPGEVDRTSKSGATEKKMTDGDGPSKVRGIEERERRSEESKIQDMVEGKRGEEKQKIVKMEEDDAEMGQGFTPNITETETKAEEFESDKLDEVKKIHELVEKKEEEDENAKIGELKFQGPKRRGKQEEIKELVEEQTLEAETDTADDTPKPVQEIEDTLERCEGKHKIEKLFQEEADNEHKEKKINDAGSRKVLKLDEPARCEKESKTRELEKTKTNDEEKEKKETETKEQEESHRPKILEEQEKIQEVAEEKTKFSRKGEVEEEIAEKKAEVSRKVGDIKQGDSDAMKGREEKDKIQELVMEDQVSDGGKGMIAAAETITENDKSRKVQEIDEQQVDKRGKQFKKLVGGEISDRRENKNVESEKKTTEAEKRSMGSAREVQEIENKDSDVTEENGKEDRGRYRDEQDEENKDKADRPETIRGTIEQELVEEETKDSDESKTKTEDDVVRKVQGIKEQELYEPKRDHVSKTKELVEEKIAESEIEAECGGLSKVHGSNEQEFHEPKKIHKERDKTRITGTEELSGQEKEEEEKEKIVESETLTENDNNSIDVEEIEKKDSDVSGKYGKEDTVQELQENRATYRNEHEEEEEKEKADKPQKKTATIEQELVNLNSQLEQDNIHEEREKTQELLQEKAKDCQEDESETKTAEPEIETEHGGLSKVHGSKEQELHEPKIHKEKEEEKIEESMTITESDNNSVDVQEMKEERPEKPESHEKQKEKVSMEELETEEDSSKKFLQEIGKQESDELKRSMVQDKMEETEEKDKPRAMEENDNVERRTKTKDGSLRKVGYDEDPELRKPYKREEEDKVQEPVEMGTSDYREKVKKQDEDVSQEAGRPERHGEQSNIPRLVEREKVEKIAEPKGKLEDDNSGKFEERKSYEDWTHEEREKRKDLVKEEATDPRDQHSGGEEQKEAKVIARAELENEEDSSKQIRQEIEKPELQRSMVQDKLQETEEKDKGRALEENEIVERRKKTKDGEDPELGELERHCKQRKIQQQSMDDENGEGKMDGDSSSKFQKQKSYEDWRQEESEEIRNLVKEEATDYPKDKPTGEEEEERFEKVSQAKTKVEDEINEKVCKNEKPESDKQERYTQLDKMEGLLGEGASDGEKEGENLVNDFTTKIQETEQEESHEKEIHEKLDIVQGFVEDKTEDQEHEKAEVAAAVVAKNENGSSRKVQTVNEQELEESRKHKDQNKMPQTKEEDEEIVSKKDTKEQETHFQDLEGKTENCKDDDEEERKQGKTVETMSRERFKAKHDDGIVRNIQATKVQESDDKKNQEPEDKTEELEKKETSNHEVKLVTEDDKLTKGQEFLEKESSNVSNRRPVEQEEFQELKEMEKREGEEKAKAETKIDNGNSRKFETSKMLELDESEENEEQKKVRKPMEEKNKVLDEEKEDIAEEKIQDKTDSRMKDQENKRQEPYELLKKGEHEDDKIPEPVVERTKYHREEEKGMEERETKETKRTAKNVSPRKSHQIEDELEKHQKPSKIPKKHNIQESEEQKIQEHGYKTISREDSREYQDVGEKRSDQEHEKIQKEGIAKGEQKEKTERIPLVEPKANDDSSRKSEIKEQESTRLRVQKKRVQHQEMVETETNDQSKEEKTEAEYDRSRKIRDNEEEKSDKLEKLEETSNRREGKEGNRAGWGEEETRTRDDGCRKVKEIEEKELAVTHKEQEKKQALVKKDLASQAKGKIDQETKDTDDSSRNVKEDEKQESDEHKRNEEQDIEESGKGDKETADANGSRKLKEIEERESNEVEKHENRDDIQEFGEENMIKQEEEEDNEPSKMQEMKEQETSEQRRLEEQERVKKSVDELEDSNMKKIQEIEKEESIDQGRDEKLEKIQEPVVMETSEDDEEEELEIEFEDSEEDWEAEVIQEMGSDEENGKIRQIKRIKLGFRLVGGSALFMSLIVIVISFIRSKKKIRCYKF